MFFYSSNIFAQELKEKKNIKSSSPVKIKCVNKNSDSSKAIMNNIRSSMKILNNKNKDLMIP